MDTEERLSITKEAEEWVEFITKLSDEDKLIYLEEEVERIIQKSSNPLKLRLLQAQCDKIRKTHKDKIAAYVAMKAKLLDHLL